MIHLRTAQLQKRGRQNGKITTTSIARLSIPPISDMKEFPHAHYSQSISPFTRKGQGDRGRGNGEMDREDPGEKINREARKNAKDLSGIPRN
jgi:hypothetical protein